MRVKVLRKNQLSKVKQLTFVCETVLHRLVDRYALSNPLLAGEINESSIKLVGFTYSCFLTKNMTSNKCKHKKYRYWCYWCFPRRWTLRKSHKDALSKEKRVKNKQTTFEWIQLTFLLPFLSSLWPLDGRADVGFDGDDGEDVFRDCLCWCCCCWPLCLWDVARPACRLLSPSSAAAAAGLVRCNDCCWSICSCCMWFESTSFLFVMFRLPSRLTFSDTAHDSESSGVVVAVVFCTFVDCCCSAIAAL